MQSWLHVAASAAQFWHQRRLQLGLVPVTKLTGGPQHYSSTCSVIYQNRSWKLIVSDSQIKPRSAPQFCFTLTWREVLPMEDVGCCPVERWNMYDEHSAAHLMSHIVKTCFNSLGLPGNISIKGWYKPSWRSVFRHIWSVGEHLGVFGV